MYQYIRGQFLDLEQSTPIRPLCRQAMEKEWHLTLVVMQLLLHTKHLHMYQLTRGQFLVLELNMLIHQLYRLLPGVA